MKGKRQRQPQPEIPVVLDCCGVDVNDPLGNHTNTFTFQVDAVEDPEDPFEGDIELVLPYNLPKNQKLPKIEIGKPETHWQTQCPTLIDDVFINAIKERRLVYKLIFLYRAAGHTKGAKPAVPKKGQEKGQTTVLNHTFFFDATCLLIRGGRFEPFLTYTASCKPPGFERFSMTVQVAHPMLSDAQIRRHEPFACMIKGIHQLPDKPVSFEELAATCVGPYVVIKGTPQPLATIPGKHGPEMKLNCAVMLWQSTLKSLQIELHDREGEGPELSNICGSAFVSPVDPTPKAPVRADPLSIDQILGVKQETAVRPYGKLSLPVATGRQVASFLPVLQRDSLVQPGFYVESGTYIAAEMEEMKKCVPVLATPPPQPPVTAKKTPQRSTPSRGGAASKTQVIEVKKPEYFFKRVVVVANRGEASDDERSFIDGLQEKIVAINALVMNINDVSTVPSMKIDKEDSECVSGFIFISESTEMYVLEILSDSETDDQMQVFCGTPPEGEHVHVFTDFAQKYPPPRLYHQFDCAVKKFKFAKPLEEVLMEPEIYIKNSHMSNCFKVLNQLNGIMKLQKFQDMDRYELWPVAEEVEMVNAKRGTLLSMEELMFPPRTPEMMMAMRSSNHVQQVEEEPIPVFTYQPVCEEKPEESPRGLAYYVAQNEKYIKNLEQKNKEKRQGLVEASADGETEIWRTNDPNSLNEKGWSCETVQPYVPLAQAVDVRAYTKMMRAEDGSEVKDGRRFCTYNYKTTWLPPIEQLKADQNRDPWTNGDLSLATAESHCHSPISSEVRARDNPLSSEEGPWAVPPQPGANELCHTGNGAPWKASTQGGTRSFAARKPHCPSQIKAHLTRDDFRPKKGQTRLASVLPERKKVPSGTDSARARKPPPTLPTRKPELLRNGPCSLPPLPPRTLTPTRVPLRARSRHHHGCLRFHIRPP